MHTCLYDGEVSVKTHLNLGSGFITTKKHNRPLIESTWTWGSTCGDVTRRWFESKGRNWNRHDKVQTGY